jgi:hypothetical protein
MIEIDTSSSAITVTTTTTTTTTTTATSSVYMGHYRDAEFGAGGGCTESCYGSYDIQTNISQQKGMQYRYI